MITAEGEAISGIAPRSRDSASDVSIDVSSRGEQWAGLGWLGWLGWAGLGWAGLGWGETWKLGNLIFHQSLITWSHVLGIYLKYASTNIIIYSKETKLIENFILEPERRDF